MTSTAVQRKALRGVRVQIIRDKGRGKTGYYEFANDLAEVRQRSSAISARRTTPPGEAGPLRAARQNRDSADVSS